MARRCCQVSSTAPDRRAAVLSLSDLEVFVPPAEYLLAMKAIAARSRPEYEDVADLRTLIRDLSLTEPEEVFGLIEHYFPHRRVPAKTRFFVESVFEEGS